MVSVLPSSIMKLGRVARPMTASTTPTASAVKKLVEAKRVAALVFRLPKAAADDGAGAVAQCKAKRLNNGHQAGNNAHRTGSAGGDLAHKKGIGQIVDAGDEHA